MEISGHTKIYGVAGYPVSHSLSPRIHNFLFRRFHIDGVYVAFPVSKNDFGSLAENLVRTSIYGLNITSPHKTGLLDEATGDSFSVVSTLSETVRLTGSMNTLVKNDGRWEGHNTDGRGICDFLEKECRFSLNGRNITVLGAGPAARAAIAELVDRGARVKVLNRSDRAFTHHFFSDSKIQDSIEVHSGAEGAADFLKNTHGLIHCTSWGQGGRDEYSDLPWSFANIQPEVVVDMNYSSSGTTSFMKLFDSERTVFDGRGMLRWQACHSFSLWTGVHIDEESHMLLAEHVGSY